MNLNRRIIMRYLIVLISISISLLFAQTMTWWVVDNGGGMQNFGSGDTIWASIGQTAIGESNTGSTYLGAGYLYIENTTLKLLENKQVPKNFAIVSIHPNPFNSSCAIEFDVPEKCDVAIELYDIQGKNIGEREFGYLQAAKYRMRWNAENLPSGTYFVRLNAGNRTITKRAVLLK